MARMKTWGGLLVVLISGMVIGAVGMGLFVRYQFQFMGSPEQFRTRIRGEILETIAREVKPAPEVMEKIDSILDRTFDQLDAIHRETEERIHTVIMASTTEIDGFLTPEQRERFQALVQKMEEHRGDGPPPPPPFF